MKELRRRWRVELAGLSDIPHALGNMPKASTFYAGQEPRFGRHVFVWIQTSVKRPAMFTANIVLTGEYGPPARWIPLERSAFEGRAPGVYRIGELGGTGDEWWSIAPSGPFRRWVQGVSSAADRAARFDVVRSEVTDAVKRVLIDLEIVSASSKDQKYRDE